MFVNGQTDWSRMRAGFEKMIEDYPHKWNLNNYARFACQAEDWSTLKVLVGRIGGNPVIPAWRNSRRLYDYYSQQIASQE